MKDQFIHELYQVALKINPLQFKLESKESTSTFLLNCMQRLEYFLNTENELKVLENKVKNLNHNLSSEHISYLAKCKINLTIFLAYYNKYEMPVCFHLNDYENNKNQTFIFKANIYEPELEVIKDIIDFFLHWRIKWEKIYRPVLSINWCQSLQAQKLIKYEENEFKKISQELLLDSNILRKIANIIIHGSENQKKHNALNKMLGNEGINGEVYFLENNKIFYYKFISQILKLLERLNQNIISHLSEYFTVKKFIFNI